MMAQLFRQQVLDNRQREWLGTVRLTRPVPLWVGTVFVVVTAAAVVAFLVLSQYTRKARVTGYLVPDRGVIRVIAPQGATVVESRVSEGRLVRAGDVLFVLAVGQSTPSGDTQTAVEATLAARQQSLRGSADRQGALRAGRIEAIDRRLTAMRLELETMASENVLQQQRLRLAEETLAQFEAYHNDNFVSEAQVRAKKEELFGVKAAVLSVARQRAVHLREIQALEAERRELPLRARESQSEIERGLAAVEQQSAENSARQTIVVRAPHAGSVVAIAVEAGQSVPAAGGLASIIPAGTRLQAQLFAPSSAIGFVRAEQVVLLRYQSFPYQKFGHQAGHVAAVARAPLPPSELTALPFLSGASTEPLYRITVALDRQTVLAYGQAQPLAPGMQLEADVVLERRRLIEWILEPVLGITSRL